MSLTNLAVAAGHAVAEWRRRRRAYAELMTLDDRTLADIGIRRSQIAGVVYGKTEPSARPSTAPASAPSAERARPAMHKAA
jgi:uncharacterized protein YjiS (DUF1127 family)